MAPGTLIEQLAAGLAKARPLPPPALRTMTWLALSLAFVAVIVGVVSPRPDIAVKLAEPRFLIEQGAALLTGLAAAQAAFASTIPGASRRWLLLPLLPLTIWIATLVQGWFGATAGGLGSTLQPDWMCLPAIMLVGSLPALAMVAMLRRGAPLTPRVTFVLGGLAAAGIGAFGLRMFHTMDASGTVLVWQVGSVVLLATVSGSFGRALWNWRRATAAARRRRR